MSTEETPVQVSIEKERGRSRAQQLKDLLTGRSPTTMKESERFERLGYLKYPMRAQLDDRLHALEKILNEINEMYEDAYTKQQVLLTKLGSATTKDAKEVIREKIRDFQDIEMGIIKQKAVQKLGNAFKLMAGPWFKGLDKPRLTKKMLMYQKVLTQLGDIPEIWRVLDYGTNALINFGWASEDVSPETPVLFETRTVIQPVKEPQFDMRKAKEQ